MAWWSTSASSKFDHNTYGLWQYTSSGKVNGISGNVDMNESFKDYPSMINTESSNTTSPTPTKSIDDLAQEVINQQWGNGNDRKQRLTSAGYDYNAVQNRVNEILGASSKKSNEEIANEVITGKWDVGQTRKEKLTAAGYDYNTIQAIVNSKCGSSSSSKSYTVKSGDTLSGIGAKLGINWKTIADKNGIKSPYTIYPGQVLKY